jgi:hypothetical protein
LTNFGFPEEDMKNRYLVGPTLLGEIKFVIECFLHILLSAFHGNLQFLRLELMGNNERQEAANEVEK